MHVYCNCCGISGTIRGIFWARGGNCILLQNTSYYADLMVMIDKAYKSSAISSSRHPFQPLHLHFLLLHIISFGEHFSSWKEGRHMITSTHKGKGRARKEKGGKEEEEEKKEEKKGKGYNEMEG